MVLVALVELEVVEEVAPGLLEQVVGLAGLAEVEVEVVVVWVSVDRLV